VRKQPSSKPSSPLDPRLHSQALKPLTSPGPSILSPSLAPLTTPDPYHLRSVDDLDDISKLEEYVESSMVILVFLSSGYFLSPNCMRELRAALALSKPLVLVHESDVKKGGATLAELRAECPEELREQVFKPDAIIVPWARIGAPPPERSHPHSLRAADAPSVANACAMSHGYVRGLRGLLVAQGTSRASRSVRSCRASCATQ
jgi:hypothetical protein